MKGCTIFTILATASASLATQLPSYDFVTGEAARTVRADQSQVCIQFQTELNSWCYSFTGPWGTASASSNGANFAGICAPTNTNGAMYIGPDVSDLGKRRGKLSMAATNTFCGDLQSNPGPGSTKFECYFDANANGNCDVFLVDGYSLSLSCNDINTGGPTIGGSVNLYKTGQTYPDQQGPNCINQNGYSPSQSDVAASIQPAVENGNNYCI